MPALILDLAIAPEQLKRLYRGTATRVMARSRSGQRVSLPATHLRAFIGHDGIRGSFRLIYAEDGAFIDLERCD